MGSRKEDITWLVWLDGRSLFRTAPGLIYLVPYLLGIILWRLGQVQFTWQQRELAVLPYEILGGVVTLYCLRADWWRFWQVLKGRPERIVACLLLVMMGYAWSYYQWDRTELERYEREIRKVEGRLRGSSGVSWGAPSVWVKARLVNVEEENLGGEGSGGRKGWGAKWIIHPDKIYLGREQEPLAILPATGLISGLYPKLLVMAPQVPAGYQPQVGDQVLLIGQMEQFPGATNPGQFDYQRYQRYSGFLGEMFEPEVRPLARPRYHLLRWMASSKEKAYLYFAGHLQQGNLPLVIALLTGESDYIPEAELERIRALGLSHLLAISGLHLGLVVSVLRQILQHLPISRRGHPWILIVAIWLAVIFVGARPSALRVGIYLTLSQVGELLQRPLHGINLLAITAFLILLVNPLALFLLSFQLSFLVYLTILLCYQPVHYLVKSWLPAHRLIQPVGESLALSITAFLGSAPVILYHFYEISLQGIVMNLWAVPLVGVILIGSLLALALGWVLPAKGAILTVVLDCLVGWFRRLVGYFYQLGDVSWFVGRPLVLWIGIFYLAGWLGWRFYQRKDLPILWVKWERRKIRPYVIILLVILGLTIFFPLKSKRLEWVLLDVGQGDGMFLRMPSGLTMLIDGGGKLGSQTYFTGEKILKPFLASQGIGQIDLLCITHFDADHVQGLIPILRDFQVQRIWMSAGSESAYVEEVLALARSRGIPIMYPTRGETYHFGEVTLEVLHPEQGESYDKENDRSLVLRLLYQGRRILLTGDLGEKAEENLLADRVRRDLGVELLKVGHHGSKYSTSEEFLVRTTPQLALISVGENRYGHPSPELLQRLFDKKCTVLRTDQSGAIRVLIRDGQVRIDKFQQK